MIEQEFHNWRTKLSKIQLDAWDELPEMDLYVDQVVSFINDHLAGLNVDPLTKSMVNNYVKKSAIMAPIKKKYSAPQIAALFGIVLLKNIYSLDGIKKGIDQLTINNYPKVVYNRFVELFNARLRNEDAPTPSPLTDTNEYMMHLVVDTAFQRILTVQLLKEMQKKETPVKPAKK
ncbi:MAG: DUF1836 domain-containing protein [Limosilactobacillus coleohominis]|uniref:DUF1836 domain-containing protein n=1 Tax=Limosilactobacillus coleohominis TaxID=181675 RepID=UPI002A8385B3|nr:DUF1836 domain-containing protein [Limosilactobacillus coleohominis]MCI5812518.1 DUF1836 domain-containing protein [Lactobacillus sp.]MDY3702012.1 DUF1836 domain-containing protein [Limosilactobacillus coleohominis]MDY5628196.1 DUF1836 domain-containing protein [Limosilactobacillus coleohominis]